MSRTTNAVASGRRKKRLFRKAKGYWGERKNHIRLTSDAVMRALVNNYRDRKRKKREFRRLWITRIAIAAKINGLSYSKFIHGLKRAKCDLNRKLLADLAVRDPKVFEAIASEAKAALATA